MAVTYTNTWKNILVALKSKIKAEMKCPVFSGFDETSKANQFIRLIPTGSEQLDKATFMEVRQYNINCQYLFVRRNNAQFQDYVLNQVSILEALVHDNITLDLVDSTKAIDVTLGTMTFDVEVDEYEDYFAVEWEFNCTHFGNTA
tara:strand:+ start:1353 stop:1787 length:435 start_codon:yes stop_codon:yes gene_type:complete